MYGLFHQNLLYYVTYFNCNNTTPGTRSIGLQGSLTISVSRATALSRYPCADKQFRVGYLENEIGFNLAILEIANALEIYYKYFILKYWYSKFTSETVLAISIVRQQTPTNNPKGL